MKKILIGLLFSSSVAFGSQIVNPGGGGINNQGTLQAGAQFYVSSGSVQGQFLAARTSSLLAVGDGTYGDFFGGTTKFTVWTTTSSNALELDQNNNFAVGDITGVGPTPTALIIDQTNGFNAIQSSTNVFRTDSDGQIVIGGPAGNNPSAPITMSVYNGSIFFGNIDGTVQLGDLGAFSSGTQLEINQQNQSINTQSTNGIRMSSASGYTGIRSSDTASDVTYTLPPDDGTDGQVLQTDGGGNLSWTTVSSGSSLASYSPTITGFGTPTAVECFWTNNGNSTITIYWKFTPSSADATEARVSLPSGLTVDSAITSNHIVGTAGFTDPGVTTNSMTVLINGGNAYFTLGRILGGVDAFANTNGSGLAGAANKIGGFATIPVTGL